MKKYLVNGHFLCRNLTGIERFSIEILNRLDEICEPDLISILVPDNARFFPQFKNITVIKAGKDLTSFWKWTQFTFGKYARKNRFTPISFANECPLLIPGYVFLHDIYCKLYPEDFSSIRDRLVRAYSCFMYGYSAHHAERLFTVSEFSRNQIAQTYHVPSSSISIIPNGWDHFKNVIPDENVYERISQNCNGYSLEKGKFYFTLGSLSKRKNLKWIADYAEKHPSDIFAISGKAIAGLIPKELEKLQTSKNVVLLGYVSDGEVKTLMRDCKAFILPSYYEGFGIPPLEALSVGAKIIVSRASCLPEIYGDAAYYIDPDNTDCNLDEIMSEPISNTSALLEKYTYAHAASKFYGQLKLEK